MLLTCGIAWVGLTCVWAKSAASLHRTFLPEPTIGHANKLDAFLEQLRETYVPMKFHRYILAQPLVDLNRRLLVFSDSSLNNRKDNYPQTCQLTFLTPDTGPYLRGLGLQVTDHDLSLIHI